jgi:branched-chain amino acid transport system substrate-binding protein
MRHRLVALAAAAVVAGGIVAGCGSSSGSSSSSSSAAAAPSSSSSSVAASTSASSTPFRVFFDADTTGPLKAYGMQDLNGLKSVVKYLNANGGIDGHQITMTAQSSNGDPSTAVSNLVKYLSSNPKPNFVFSGTAGDETAAMIPVMARMGLLGASVNDGSNQCAKNSQTTCPTFFTVAAPSDVPQESVGNFMASKGYKKVGIIALNEAFTQTETPAVTTALKSHGISVTTSSFPQSATSVVAEMQELKQAGAQAVYAEVLGAPAGYVAEARAKLGWNVPIVYDLAASSLDITKLAPASDLKNTFELVFRTNEPKIAAKLPGIQALISGAKAYGGVGGPIPVNISAFPWDDMLVVAAGAKAAGSIEAKAIMGGMEQAPITNPELALNATQKYTAATHENLGALPSEYPVVPVAPIANGLIGG